MAAGERARALLAEAETQAAALRSAAAQEAAEARRAAEAAGFAEGQARAAAAWLTLAAERSALEASQAEEVGTLALAVARQVLGELVATDPRAVVTLAERALTRARSMTALAIRVSPGDLPRVREGLPRLAELVERGPGLALSADPSLPPGAVVVEGAEGRIDARIEAQLEVLERTLAETAA